MCKKDKRASNETRNTHLFPVLVREVLRRRPSLNTSTVDDDVDDQAHPTLSLASGDLLAQPLDLGLVSKIALDDVDLTTERDDLIAGLVVWGGSGSLNEDDVGSGLSKGQDHGLTDSSSAWNQQI
jgi:hypothetical protein